MKEPSISVIVPVFNCEDRLPQLIENLLQQPVQNLEILIVDYGSMDATAEVLQPYWNAVRYLFLPAANVTSALNSGIREAAGHWLAFLHAQDYWYPDKLQQQLAAVKDVPSSIGICACDTSLDSDLELPETAFQNVHRNMREPFPTRDEISSLMVEGRHGITRSSFIVRRSFAQQISGFDERLQRFYNTDFLFRVSLFSDFLFVPAVLVRMSRESEENCSAFLLDKSQPSNFVTLQYIYRKWWRASVGSGNRIRSTIAVQLAELYESWAEMHLCSGNIERAVRALRRASRTRMRMKHIIKRWMIMAMPEICRKQAIKKNGMF